MSSNRMDIPINIHTPTSTNPGSNEIKRVDNNNRFEVVRVIEFIVPPGLSFFDYDYDRVLTRSLNDNGLEKNNDIVIDAKGFLNKKENCNCSICCETINMNDRIIELKCEHDFHEQCIGNWVKYKQNCPICRKAIPYKFKSRQR